jgi:hypothetical protein
MNLCLHGRAVRTLALLAPVALAAGCHKAADPEPEASSEPEFSVTAEALAREYETDSAAADRKYKGKWMLVEGPMEDVELSPSGYVTVTLKGFALEANKDRPGHIVRGDFLPTETGRLADLTPGQQIQFKGKCDGAFKGEEAHDSPFVEFLGCQLVVVGPDPSLPVTAAQLTGEYVRNEKAADAKYKDKYLVIEGTVVELQEKDGLLAILLEGHDEKSPAPIRVAAGYSEHRRDQFAALKKGSKVNIKGACAGRLLGVVFIRSATLVP